MKPHSEWITMPDLKDGQAFETWWQTVRAKGLSLEETIELLESQGTPIASLRAAALALDLPGTDTERIRRSALLARLGGGRDLTAFADSLLAYATLRDIRASEGSSDRQGASSLIPGLLASLDDLTTQEKESPLGFEAEIRLHIVLSNAFQQTTEFQKALDHASKAFLLAENLKLPQTGSTALVHMTCSMIGVGRFSDSYNLMEAEVKRFPAWSSPTLREEYQRLMANALFSLGDHQGSLKVLNELQYANPEQDWIKAEILLCRGLIGADMGANLPCLDYEWSSLYDWLLEAMHTLIKVGSLPRLNTTAQLRETLLRKVIELCRPDETIRDPMTEVYGAWAQALAYLWLGETGLAGSALNSLHVNFREWLDLRLALAAGRLELSLQLNDAGVHSVSESENELRFIFEDAKDLPYASRIGLAQRVRRWHPLVAAYCAVMPDPIPEFLDATEIILRIGSTNMVYGLMMPSVYAAELILRCLHIADKHFVQAPLNKMQINRRESLMSQHSGTEYWRPVVSGVHLIYGLIKAGQGRSEYLKAAQTVAADFGVVPRTRAAYAEDYLTLIDELTNDLLLGTISDVDFATQLLQAPNLF